MNNKKISKKQAEKVLGERDPYVGIVLEEINDNLKVLSEGYETVQQRFDRLGDRMGKMEIHMESIAADLHAKADKKEVTVLERRVTHLESN